MQPLNKELLKLYINNQRRKLIGKIMGSLDDLLESKNVNPNDGEVIKTKAFMKDVIWALDRELTAFVEALADNNTKELQLFLSRIGKAKKSGE